MWVNHCFDRVPQKIARMMIIPPIRINAKTDKGRTIILHPIWCTKKREYLLYDEAVMQYRAAFNKSADMFVVIMMDGKDVSDRRFVMKKVDEGDIEIKSSIGKNDDRFTIVGKLVANDDDTDVNPKQKQLSSHLNPDITTNLSCHRSHRTKYQHILAMTFNLEKTLKKNIEPRVELVDNNGFKIVLLNLAPGKSIGVENDTKPEIHPTVTQTIIVQNGSALVRLFAKNEKTSEPILEQVCFISSKQEDTIVIPSNTYHFIENVDVVPFIAVSFYAPTG